MLTITGSCLGFLMRARREAPCGLKAELYKCDQPARAMIQAREAAPKDTLVGSQHPCSILRGRSWVLCVY